MIKLHNLTRVKLHLSSHLEESDLLRNCWHSFLAPDTTLMRILSCLQAYGQTNEPHWKYYLFSRGKQKWVWGPTYCSFKGPSIPNCVTWIHIGINSVTTYCKIPLSNVQSFAFTANDVQTHTCGQCTCTDHFVQMYTTVLRMLSSPSNPLTPVPNH